MVGNPRAHQLTPAIRATLDALRRRIRRYVWLEGLAVATVWLGVAFWVGLGLDWFFEPPAVVRGLWGAAVVLVLLAILYWWIVRRAFVRLSNRSMAMLLERAFPQFRESLLTAVELTERRPAAAECNPLLLERTCRQAAEALPAVRLGAVFNPTPLWRSFSGAVLLLLSIACFAGLSPNALGVWARRTLLLSADLWPRQTRLVLEGFADGRVKVARGADFEVVAKADLAKPQVPQTVEIRYRTDAGARGRAAMSREGQVDRSRDRFQEYAHTFRSVLTPIRFDVVGGDDAVRNLRIEVVESPTIVEMALECRFPSYMDRPPRTLPVSGVMQIPAGTQVTLHARSNKDLVEVAVQSALDDPPQPPQRIAVAAGADRRAFTWELGVLTADQTLLFSLLDTDGIKSREPVRLPLACLADEAPRLAVRLSGIGPAITPAAYLPTTGHVTDDYGIARTWFEYVVENQEPQLRPISAPPGNPTDLALDAAFEVSELKLQAGQKLLLAVKAADRCNLVNAENIGASERWLLDIVTPEQLRTMLEARELVLRQRFESILNDVTETRDSLLHITLGPSNAAAASAASDPGEQSAGDDVAEPRLGQHALRVQRAIQNSRKDASEVLGVAEAFDDIRLELIHNRIDTVELRKRLEQGISQPLRQIANPMFPEFERRLTELEGRLNDPQRGAAARDAACQQCDAILGAMRQVLGRMLELEDFNEAVELLRNIINAQEKLRDQTQQKHKQKLRDLLEN